LAEANGPSECLLLPAACHRRFFTVDRQLAIAGMLASRPRFSVHSEEFGFCGIMAAARQAGDGSRRAPANTSKFRKDSTMTRDDIAAVISRVPELNPFGACLSREDRKLPPDQRAAKLRQEQAELLGSAENCTKICEWLAGLEKIKTPVPNSYGLKHVFSGQPGNPYVTNGEFIAAAIHSGLTFKVEDYDPNVLFGISDRSVKAARRSAKSLV